jgi:hypothetical protein
VYVGSELTKLKLQIDTSQTWLIIASNQNNATSGAKFNPASSTTYTKTSANMTTIAQGKGYVLGYKSQDQVFFDDEKTLGVAGMDFILAISDNTLDPDSGVIGFARNFKTRRTAYEGTTFLSRLQT